MKSLKALFTVAFVALFSVMASAQSTKYKCMIQMVNYIGKEAYVVASVVSKEGKYVKTLYVLGKDQKWYHDLEEWHKANKSKLNTFNAITGASVAGGDRSVITVDIDKSYIDKGYMLRFESAVENKGYHVKDLEFPLTTQNLANKQDGTGSIRYVRFTAL